MILTPEFRPWVVPFEVTGDIYWNMNYHVEHHMYPGVPCYHLPRLRKLIEADLGPATLGLRGIVKAMRQDHAARQLGDCTLNAA
ncbi:MAG: fatty acid desaturase [Solirubrobacterales bacterium]